jgi:hypothetical protein
MSASAYVGATRNVGVVVSPQHMGDRPTDFVYARVTAIGAHGRVCILARPPFKATSRPAYGTVPVSERGTARVLHRSIQASSELSSDK